MRKLTKKQAIELSILKWEWIVDNNGSVKELEKELPELENLDGNCGLCEYVKLYYKQNCSKCSLYKITNTECINDEHVWSIWFDNPCKENAQKVLDLIKSIKV